MSDNNKWNSELRSLLFIDRIILFVDHFVCRSFCLSIFIVCRSFCLLIILFVDHFVCRSLLFIDQIIFHRGRQLISRMGCSEVETKKKFFVFCFLFSKTFLVSFAKILVEIAFVKVFLSLN